MRLIDADTLEPDAEYDDGEYWAYSRTQIDNAPTIEPERKGKWIKVDNGYSYLYVCSECGCEPLRSKWNGREVFSDFCPNCGAKM